MPSQLKKSTKSNASQAVQAERKFCKVCHDAGKSSTAYSSHYVRESIGGKVICPTILSQHCNYCKQIGHTPSYCPALEGKYNKNKVPTPLQNRAARLCESPPPPEPLVIEKTPLQIRAARLCESPPPPTENYFKPITVKQTRRWETIIKPQAQHAKPAAQQAQQAEEQTPAEEQAPAAATEYIPKDYSNCSWADM